MVVRIDSPNTIDRHRSGNAMLEFAMTLQRLFLEFFQTVIRPALADRLSAAGVQTIEFLFQATVAPFRMILEQLCESREYPVRFPFIGRSGRAGLR